MVLQLYEISTVVRSLHVFHFFLIWADKRASLGFCKVSHALFSRPVKARCENCTASRSAVFSEVFYPVNTRILSKSYSRNASLCSVFLKLVLSIFHLRFLHAWPEVQRISARCSGSAKSLRTSAGVPAPQIPRNRWFEHKFVRWASARYAVQRLARAESERIRFA